MKPVKEQINVALVDKDNGDILDEQTLKPGDRYGKRTEAQDTYTSRYETHFNDGHTFLKFFDKMLPYLVRELRGNETNFLLLLVPFISYEDCLLRPHGDSRYTAFTNTDDIYNAVQEESPDPLPKSTFYKYIKALTQKEVLVKIETGEKIGYMINPYIVYKGSKIEKTSLNVVKDWNTKWEKYNDEIEKKEGITSKAS